MAEGYNNSGNLCFMSSELIATYHHPQGPCFQIDIYVVRLPTGHTVDMEIVRHPGSVVLLLISEPGSIDLIWQYRYTIDRWIWEWPVGSLKRNEDPDRAAARECEEEIGLVPGTLTRLRRYYPTPGFGDEQMVYSGCPPYLRPPGPDSTARKDEDEEIGATRVHARRGSRAGGLW